MFGSFCYKKPGVFFAGLFLCLSLTSFAFAAPAKKANKDTDAPSGAEKVYHIGEAVSDGELSPEERMKNVDKDKKKQNQSFFEMIKARMDAEKKESMDAEKIAEKKITYTITDKDGKKTGNTDKKADKTDKEKADSGDDEYADEYNRDNIPYYEREHPYIDFLIDVYNQIPTENKKKIIRAVKDFMKYKDEIIEKVKEFYNKTLPDAEKEMAKKALLAAKGKKGPYEENLITPYIYHPYMRLRLKACKSHVTDGDIAALIDLKPTYTPYTGIAFRDLDVKISESENMKKNSVYHLLPAEDGFFYSKTYGILLLRAESLDKDLSFTADVSYRMCERGIPCKRYNEKLSMVIPKPTKEIEPFDTTYCSSLPSILKSIPSREFSSIKIRSAVFNADTGGGEITVDFADPATRPSLYYYDGKKQVYASSEPVSSRRVVFRFPYRNNGDDHLFIVRDGNTGLEFKLGSLIDDNSGGLHLAKLLFGVVEKGFLLNFRTPLLLLLFLFFNSFASFGQGRDELVKSRAKEIIYTGGGIFSVLALFFAALSAAGCWIVYGRQFVWPLMNFLLLGFVFYILIKKNIGFKINTFLAVALTIGYPFIGDCERIFNLLAAKGPFFIGMFFICAGIGVLLPYIVSYFLSSYVIICTPMDGLLYRIRHIKWLPLAVMAVWYVVLIPLNIGGFYAKGAEPYSLEKLKEINDSDKVAYINVNTNYSLSSILSKYVVNEATTGKSGNKSIRVLQVDYFDRKAMDYLKTIGIDNPSKSMFVGPQIRGGYIIEGMVRAGMPAHYFSKVNY